MRKTVRFILAGKVEEIRLCGPTDTVLDYLRKRKKLTGSKEGCAEGDCGACTVVLAEVVDDQLHYKAVNSCIAFLPTLDGKQLITIEDLQQEDGSLHPVQQAMVDQHGSQCGFCTPGFVMSLFAMYHDRHEQPPTREQINQTLAGNLCRCTGYAPIISAAQQSMAGSRSDQFMQCEHTVVEQLKALRSEQMLATGNSGQQYFAPTTIAELCTLLDTYPHATMVAGATDVGLWVTKQLQQPETIIYIAHVEELQRIECNENTGELSIGAAVTYTQAMPHILNAYPDFEELLIRLGALQVRNAGTVGGNIANGSPIGDMPPGLIALDARLVLAGSGGERTIRLEDFFIAYGRQDLQPGECVARILLPPARDQQYFRTYKVSKRTEQDISAVCAAFNIEIINKKVLNARICYGGMAETPRRAGHCEDQLTGQPWNEHSIDAAIQALGDDYQPITDMRASANYRMLVAQNLLRRFYIETSDPDFAVRITRHFTASQRVI